LPGPDDFIAVPDDPISKPAKGVHPWESTLRTDACALGHLHRPARRDVHQRDRGHDHRRPGAVTFSPGRIDATNSVWSSSRKPLVGEFRFAGRPLFLIANHFVSKGGDDPLFGQSQPPQQPSETKRDGQASVVRSFVDSLLALDGSARVVVAGDLNDLDFSQTANILVGSGATALTDLPRTLPVAKRSTYDFEGNAQVLDHLLLSPSLTTFGYDVVHVNSEFADQVSDHDPQVVRLSLALTDR
jgi:predicted extracellular nuclease